MSERNGFEPGVPCWVDTWQPDADEAVSFYTALFGWDAEDTMPPGVSGKHYMCRLRGRDVAAIASRPEGAPPMTAWTTYIWSEDLDAAIARVTDAGGTVLKEPFDSLDGGRIAIAADPAGAAFGIWQPGSHRGAQLINEPGAWAMSMLVTPDSDGAIRFYSGVFGWETAGFDLGDEELTMFTLPGYVGGEPQQPVPRDVVATLAPPGAADGSPAHWSVDFWIGDADAAAAKTAEMGGKVIAGPYDVPAAGMRQAILVDPQGAAFSVTRPPGVPA